jgi:dTDP-4-amino-4,6-dideoxygalactose transaminase
MRAMKEAGITVSQVHARNDGHTMFAEFKTSLPGVDEFAADQVSIPVGWWLTDDQLQHIINQIRRFYA